MWLKNGRAIEYDNIYGYKIFDGFYKNGQRDGLGIEYRYGILSFFGEYFNGKRNGKGKEHSGNQIICEGEYVNDLKDGNIKEYDHKNNLIFDGEYRKGEKNKLLLKKF